MSKAIQALNFCNETLSFKNDIEVSFLELGARLQEIRDKALYADQWEDFASYLMEFKNLSEASASKLINIYQRFVIEYGVPRKLIGEAGWTSLAETLPIVKNKKDAMDWVERAILLTRTDLRREIKEAKTGKLMAQCDHKKYYLLKVCEDCGVKHKVHE